MMEGVENEENATFALLMHAYDKALSFPFLPPVVSLLNFFGTMLVPKIAEKGVLLRSKRGPRFREKGG